MGKTGNLFLLLHVMSDFVGKDRFFSESCKFLENYFTVVQIIFIIFAPARQKICVVSALCMCTIHLALQGFC